MHFKKILLILLVFLVSLFLFSFLLKNSYSYLDPDLGWHFKVGQDILEKGNAPRYNHYNFTLLGESWIDHEWAMEVLMFVLYDYSYFFLHLFFVFIVLFAFFIALLPILKENKFKTPVLIASSLPLIFGIYTSAGSFGLRPQEFALLFVAILLFILYIYKKTNNWKYWILFIPLFFIWANLHGSFVLGLGLLLAWYLIKTVLSFNVFKKIFNRINLSIGKELKRKEKKMFLIIFLLIFISTLLNPYGIDLYSSLIEYSNTFYLSNIAEWLSQFSYPFNYYQLLYLTISLALVLIYIYENIRNNKRISIWSLFLFFFFLILAFKSRRHFPLFIIVNIVFFVQVLLFYGNEFKKLKPKKPLFIVNSLIAIIIFILLIINNFNQINWHKDPFNHFCRRYPCQAVEYLKNNRDLENLNIYNNYGWGGYMIWTYPERLLFIDGRMPHYPYEGRSILEEYSDFKKDDSGLLEELIQKHNIELFLIRSQEQKLSFRNWEKFLFGFKDENIVNKKPLRDYLKDSNDWENIYEDDVAIIFKKK